MNGYLSLSVLLLSVTTAFAVTPQNYQGKIARRFAGTLPKYHVLQHRLDDSISRKAWTNVVTVFDYDHSVFLKGDLDGFAEHLDTIDDELKIGDVRFGFEVYNLFVERLRERMDFATNLLVRGGFDFSTDEIHRLKRKDAPWPETRAEAEEHWRRRIKHEILLQYVGCFTNSVPAAGAELPPVTNITANLVKKYRQYVTVMSEPDEEQVLQFYLSAVARAYDPHSDYMSPASKEDFDMEMNLSLCGVGAVLQMDEGALKIVEIMKGGPIERDGRIQEGDRIIGVRQGDGEMEDVMWKPMKKTIQKIRGPKGTRVTLQILPVTDPTGATKREYELVRDEIKLEDQAATGRVETVTLNGVTNRIGYIHLPGFYGTMDRKPGEEGYRSCALDVAEIIAEQNAEDAEAFVLDLRGNGGGSLMEAVRLSALFVREGPVVQIRDTRQTIALPIPPGNPVACDKPLVVLTDRASASASEIVAGHLQDVGRAIVLGDNRTHGKGTVQTVMGLGPERYGSMKVTTARFYRIDGRSTQVEGVHADIVFPSLLDSLDIGEDKLPNALPFSRIMPCDYEPVWNLDRHVGELARLAEARLRDDREWQDHLANVKGMREIADREEITLELAARIELDERDRKLREIDAAKEDDDGEEESVRDRKDRPDPMLKRALDVTADLIRLNGGEIYGRRK